MGYGPTVTTDTLNKAKVPPSERIMLTGSVLADSNFTLWRIYGRLCLLTRKGVNLMLMFSGKPIAQETRQWLAGDVMPAIADTGGYLLNEAARETARADTRQGVNAVHL